MEEGMLILEAKDMAADKMSKGNKKDEEQEENVDGDLMNAVENLLNTWPDTEHEYYKDLTDVYMAHGGEEIETEETEEEEDYGY